MSRVANLPAGLPLLSTLAEGLLAAYADRLADCLVFLPSRRACLGLRDAFLQVTQRDALLLPRLQPVGEAGLSELPLGEGDEDIPAAIQPLRRQLLLTGLIKAMRRSEAQGITDEHAIRLAAELARFLDELQTEEVGLECLDQLVEDEFAEHWQGVLKFLNILGRGWPHILDEEGAIDPSHYRRRLLERQIDLWQRRPPTHPVIVAGVTGSIPVVARLLACISGLPQGLVLLPGLDRAMDEASWDAVARSPAHPQYALRRLIDLIGIDRHLVPDWRGITERGSRRRLVSDVMRPPATSSHWPTAPAPEDEALAELEWAELPDLATEAELLCLRIRAELEEPARRIALITADRNLGRRVAAELRRFNIIVDDSAGLPLDQTAPGRFLLLSARAVVERLPPVPLLALLKHPLARGGIERPVFRSFVRLFERTLLRGPRPADSFSGLLTLTRAAVDKGRMDASIVNWLDAVGAAAAPFVTLAESDRQSIADLIEVHLSFAEWLACDEQGSANALWSREAGEAAAAFFAELAHASRDLEPIAVSAYPAILAVLMGAHSVYPRGEHHPRVTILGQLESRLLEADTVLIGGLNEGTWPRPPEPSPWLNRRMRYQLKMPPAEQVIGIAALDFSQALMSRRVLLTRARKDASGAPTTASRWMVRLGAVLRAKGMEHRIEMAPPWRQWATRRARPVRVKPIERPSPKPPVLARPREFWISDIEALITDPYRHYAQRILGLRELEPLDAEPSGAERGVIIHAILEDFVRQYPFELPLEPHAELMALGERHFARLDQNPQMRAIWWPRFREIATWFVETERKRREHAIRVLAEGRGGIQLQGHGGPIWLRARADRIELSGRQVNIVDYKTGHVPSKAEVVSGQRPQLPLTALIAREGGFESTHGNVEAAELLYWSLKGGRRGAESKNPLEGRSVAEVIDEARDGVIRLVEYFAQEDTAFPATPRPEVAGLQSPFHHLARNKEWQGGMAVRGQE